MVGMAKLGEAVRSCGLNARMLVLEITEHERVTHMPLLREAIDAVHACGAVWRWTTLAMAAPACACGPR